MLVHMYVYPLLFLSAAKTAIYNAEFDYFLRGKESIRMDIKVADVRGLSRSRYACVAACGCGSVEGIPQSFDPAIMLMVSGGCHDVSLKTSPCFRKPVILRIWRRCEFINCYNV